MAKFMAVISEIWSLSVIFCGEYFTSIYKKIQNDSENGSFVVE